ncbi:hypothetical protein BC941DRAFT_455149 [Chlamydoabsidia padenii]|nr:hypothetical protein BC941DRAFT_455149 [Chlamydoabsidia padenii]
MDPTWQPFVTDLPGKTTVDQPADNYLLHLLRDPHIEEHSGQRIQPLDSVTLKDAYNLKEGPIPGFDITLLGTDDTGRHNHITSIDSDSERKHRKKRKKRKHSHDHHDEDGHSDHKKKRKKKKERDHSSKRGEEIDGDTVIVD